MFKNIKSKIFNTLRLHYGKSGLDYRAEKRIFAGKEKVVLSGPFAGMKMPSEAHGSVFWAKILGCYEAELHSVIEEIRNHNYQTIIDVGCAEGYYAVGFARIMKKAEIFAYDISPVARALCQQSAELNLVQDRVIIGGICDCSVLNTFSLVSTLLICDCEGYELELLQTTIVPSIKNCDILVELHDIFHPGLTKIIVDRFRNTHEIVLLSSVKRHPNDFPILHKLKHDDQARLLNEGRAATMQWAYMRAKSAQDVL